MIELVASAFVGNMPLALLMIMVAWRFDRRLVRIETKLNLKGDNDE